MEKESVRLLDYIDAPAFPAQFNALTRLLHIASVALGALASVQALQWMQTLCRSVQRRRATYDGRVRDAVEAAERCCAGIGDKRCGRGVMGVEEGGLGMGR